MKSLILGATGLIGGAIARALLERGHQVRALRRDGSRTTALDDLVVEYVPGDLADPVSLTRAAEGCEAVFHAAAPFPKTASRPSAQIDTAVSTMANVLDAASRTGARRLVYVSSYTTIGPPAAKGVAADESCRYDPSPQDPLYFRMKAAMEDCALGAARGGAPVVIVNPSACFGPGDVKPTMGRLLLLYAKSRCPVYLPGGIDVVDVRSVARASVAALEMGAPGRRYILAGQWVPLRDLAREAAHAVGSRAAFVSAPYPLIGALARAAEAAWRLLPGGAPAALAQNVEMLRRTFPLDAARARAELGLEPTDVTRTIHDSIAWFRRHGYM